jgi:holliday junction DNA helicase RuvA
VIDRLTGTVVAKSIDSAVIDVGGVGFRVEMSATSLRDLAGLGQPASCFTYLHVREDALQLYGFSTEDERELFQLFLGVSKIGPKLALAALSARRPADLRRALAFGDVAVFQTVPGIGKRTAERLILELKDRVGDLTPGGAGPPSSGEPSGPDGIFMTARAALQELGLTLAEADHLLQGADLSQPIETLIRQALGRRR